MADKALDGVRVLELASLVSGPYCTKLLADLGAETIKIERPGTGDEARTRGPFPKDDPHPECSGLFLYLNTNKLGLTLNIETPAGRKIFMGLVRDADILVQDTPPKKMEELGLDYESLSAINPKLIVTSITPFGLTGPYRDYKAHHLNSFHAGGQGHTVPDTSGEQGRPPLKGGGFLGDYDAGLCAAVATLGALYACMVSGKGQHIDVSKQEAISALERVDLARYPYEGHVTSRYFDRPWVGGLMKCNDGYLVITPAQDHQYRALVEAMGNPEWSKEERFKDETARTEHAEELNSLISQWMATRSKEEVYHKAQALGSPVSPVYSPEELLNSQQVLEREFIVEADHPVAGTMKYPSAPYKFSKTPWRIDRPAPLLGEHNEEIYCGRYGYTREELIRLRDTEVI